MEDKQIEEIVKEFDDKLEHTPAIIVDTGNTRGYMYLNREVCLCGKKLKRNVYVDYQ